MTCLRHRGAGSGGWRGHMQCLAILSPLLRTKGRAGIYLETVPFSTVRTSSQVGLGHKQGDKEKGSSRLRLCRSAPAPGWARLRRQGFRGRSGWEAEARLRGERPAGPMPRGPRSSGLPVWAASAWPFPVSMPALWRRSWEQEVFQKEDAGHPGGVMFQETHISAQVTVPVAISQHGLVH